MKEKTRKFTEKQIAVIKCSALGYTDNDIANELHVSIGYIRSILDKLYERTETRNKAHLVSWAYRNKVLGG